MFRIKISLDGPLTSLSLFIEVAFAIIAIISSSFDICAYITVIQTALAVIVVYNSGYELVSLPTFFIIFAYIFHCSQFILYTLNVDYSVAFDIVKQVGIQSSVLTMKFFILSITFLTIGFLIKTEKNWSMFRGRVLDIKDYSSAGKKIMTICALPRLYIDFSHLIQYLTLGYEATYTNESGLMLVWAYGFYLGFIFYLVGNRYDTGKTFRALVIFAFYLLMMMVSGRRLEQAGVLLSVLILYIRYCKRKKIKTSTLVVASIAGYVALSIIATMGDLRYATVLSFQLYFNTFLSNLTGGVLTGQLAEFGDTGMPLAYSIISFPEYHPFHYGLTYVFAWVQVIPNIGGFVRHYFETSLNFTAAIPDTFRSNFGCSYLGELFFNFGWFGAIANLFIGIIIGRMWYKIDKSLSEGAVSTKTMMYIAMFPSIFTFIRGSFGDFVRIWVYYSILMWFIAKRRNRCPATTLQYD